MATPTAAKIGYGSELRVKIGASFERVAEVHDIDGPNEEQNDVEVTNLDSAGRRREYIPGLTDPGMLTLETNFTKGEYNRLRDLKDNATVTDWEYELTDGSLLEFQGYVKAVGLRMVVDDKITSPVTVKITGDVEFTAAA